MACRFGIAESLVARNPRQRSAGCAADTLLHAARDTLSARRRKQPIDLINHVRATHGRCLLRARRMDVHGRYRAGGRPPRGVSARSRCRRQGGRWRRRRRRRRQRRLCRRARPARRSGFNVFAPRCERAQRGFLSGRRGSSGAHAHAGGGGTLGAAREPGAAGQAAATARAAGAHSCYYISGYGNICRHCCGSSAAAAGSGDARPQARGAPALALTLALAPVAVTIALSSPPPLARPR